MFGKKYTVAQLVRAGGNEWKKDQYHRVYFNPSVLAKLYGLELQNDNAGKISSATLNGKPMTGEAGWKIMVEFSKGKFWYDLANHRFHARDIDDEKVRAVEEALKRRL